jgi:hypothetical protein
MTISVKDGSGAPQTVKTIDDLAADGGQATLGANADAASATTSISSKLRAIATALGVTALDLGSGTAGSRTLRFFKDTAQWTGGSGANGTAVQRVTVATDDVIIASLATAIAATNTKLDSLISGELTVGTAGSASTQVVSMQGIASMTPIITTESKSATGTQTIVAGSATDVTILASNSSRLGGSVFNDGVAILYLLLSSATSSNTVFSIALGPSQYFEIPFGYTGVLKGLWASATGSARVTEFT